MKVSLVTPVYNQARSIEETIESVLSQDVPDLEYIVIDGGSTDGTVEILRRYETRFAWFRSERDRGQVDALNKGFARATGSILGFINADDVLLPGALRTVLAAFSARPEIDLVYGGVEWIDVQSKALGFHQGDISSLSEVLDIYGVWWRERQWVQPEVFYRSSLRDRVGPFDEHYNLAFDYDFWVRCFAAGARVARLPERLAKFRLHANQKSTAGGKAADEIRAIVRRHLDAGAAVGRFQRTKLQAQLSYDLYQLGQSVWAGQPRPSFLHAFLLHPEWLLAAPARSRARAACTKLVLGGRARSR